MATKSKPAKKRQRAAPRLGASKISAATFAAILADISAGKAAWRAIEDNGKTRDAFYKLVARDPKAQDRYARAKESGLDVVADEIIMIADQSRIGEKRKTTLVKMGEGGLTVELPGEEVTTGDMVERTKLQIDARKWLLSKLNPKKYGDRTALEHSFDPKELMSTLDAARERALKN